MVIGPNCRRLFAPMRNSPHWLAVPKETAGMAANGLGMPLFIYFHIASGFLFCNQTTGNVGCLTIVLRCVRFYL